MIVLLKHQYNKKEGTYDCYSVDNQIVVDADNYKDVSAASKESLTMIMTYQREMRASASSIVKLIYMKQLK